MTDYKIIENGDLRKYFTQIPNMVDDTKMSVYAFRLYVHLKRVAGNEGKCFQSTRTLSQSCNMSLGSISKAKVELIKLKLISINKKPTRRGGKDYHEVTIADIWENNFKEYASSPDELGSSQDEQASSPGEIKKNSFNKNPIKKDGDEPPLSPSKREIQNGIRKSLEDYFVEITKLGSPKTKTKAQQKSAGTLWWNPLRDIADLAEWDVTEGKLLIFQAIERLNGLTISNPKSILKTAQAIWSEGKRKPQQLTTEDQWKLDAIKQDAEIAEAKEHA